GPIFRRIYLVATKHRFDTLTEPAGLGELDEKLKRFLSDAVLGVIEIDAGCFGGETLAPARVAGKELPQVQLTGLFVMRFQRPPGWLLSERQNACHDVTSS